MALEKLYFALHLDGLYLKWLKGTFELFLTSYQNLVGRAL